MGFFDSSSESTSEATDRRQAATDQGTNIGDSAALAPNVALASGNKSTAVSADGILASKGATVTVERLDAELVGKALADVLGFAEQTRADSFSFLQSALADADPEPAVAVQETVKSFGTGAIVLAALGLGAAYLFMRN